MMGCDDMWYDIMMIGWYDEILIWWSEDQCKIC